MYWTPATASFLTYGLYQHGIMASIDLIKAACPALKSYDSTIKGQPIAYYRLHIREYVTEYANFRSKVLRRTDSAIGEHFDTDPTFLNNLRFPFQKNMPGMYYCFRNTTSCQQYITQNIHSSISGYVLPIGLIYKKMCQWDRRTQYYIAWLGTYPIHAMNNSVYGTDMIMLRGEYTEERDYELRPYMVPGKYRPNPHLPKMYSSIRDVYWYAVGIRQYSSVHGKAAITDASLRNLYRTIAEFFDVYDHV